MEQLVAENPRDVSAWSILNIAANYITLSLDANSEAEGILPELKPDTELQKVLKALAMPENGIDDLTDFVKSRPGWAVARAAHATAQCDLWHITREPSTLKLARQEIDAAALLLPDHPFVKTVNLYVVTAECIDLGERKLSTTESLERGHLQAENLRQEFRDYAFGQRFIGEFYSATRDYDIAITIWEQLIMDLKSQKAMAFAIPLWNLTDRTPGVPSAVLPSGYYHLKGDAEGFRRKVLEDPTRLSNLFRAWLPIQLRYLGNPVDAIRAADQIESLTKVGLSPGSGLVFGFQLLSSRI
jgi:hypothetical protein